MGAGSTINRSKSTFDYVPPNLISLSTIVSITIRTKRARRERIALIEGKGKEKDILLRQEKVIPSEKQLNKLLSNTVKRLFLLDDLNDTQINQLVNCLKYEHYERDTILFREGDHCTSAYIIERGEVDVIINKAIIRKLTRGEIFGELGLLFEVPRTATIKTSTYCSLYVLESELYNNIQKLSNTPSINQRYKWLCNCPDLQMLLPLQMSRLFTTIKRVRYHEQDTLFRESETVDRVILIEKGIAEVFITSSLEKYLPKKYNSHDVDRVLGIIRPPNISKSESKSQSLKINESTKAIDFLNRDNSIDSEIDMRELDKEESDDEQDLYLSDSKSLLLSEGCIIGIPLLRAFLDQRSYGIWYVSLEEKNEEIDGEDPDDKISVISPFTLIAQTDLVCSVFTVNSFKRLFQNMSPSRVPSATTLLANSKLKSFDSSKMEYLTVLGEGGFGKVLLATYSHPFTSSDQLNTNTNTNANTNLFAVKFLSKYSVYSSGQYQRVLNERKLLVNFESNFIICLYGTFQTPSALGFVMEVLDRGDFWSVLYENDVYPNGLPPELVRFYTANVVYGLAHMHSMNIAYRDLKPENLMINSAGYLKIIDCGLAKRIPFEETDCYGVKSVKKKSHSICGTPEYLAPEFIFCSGNDHGADLWALGIMIHEMYLLFTPFTSPNESQIDVESLFASIAKVQSQPILLSLEIDNIDGTPHATKLISDLLQIEPVNRIGYCKTSEIFDHEYFQSVDLNSIYHQNYIPSYIPPDPGLVTPFLNQYSQENQSSTSSNKVGNPTERSPRQKIILESCLNFKDFPHENQDFFKEF